MYHPLSTPLLLYQTVRAKPSRYSLKKSLVRLLMVFFYIGWSCPIMAVPNGVEVVLAQVDSLMEHKEYAQSRALLLDLVTSKRIEEKNIAPAVYSRLIDVEISSHDLKKALFYIGKLEKLDSYKKDPELYFQVEMWKGFIYRFTGRYDLAIIIYHKLVPPLEAAKAYKKLSNLYNALGGALFYLQLEKTEESFLKSIEYARKINKTSFAAYNNLIDYYLENLNYKAASSYIDSLQYYATEQENYINIVSAKTKQAHLFSKIGQGREAKKLMQECRKIRTTQQLNFPISDMIFDSYVYQANGELDSAILSAEPVLKYALEKNEIGLVELCMPHLAKLYSESGDKAKAVNIYEQFIFLQKTQNKTSQIENITSLEKPDFAPSPNGNHLTFLQGLLAALLLSGLLFWIFWRSHRPFEKTAEVSENPDLQTLQSALQCKTELLVKKELGLQQNIDFLNTLKTDIRNLGHDKSKLSNNINLLINKVNSSIQFQSRWEEIHHHFAELYPTFLPQLKTEYPTLTDTELRHCLFLKLNLTIEEVAQILNIETTSVSSARYRLKKKVAIDRILKMN